MKTPPKLCFLKDIFEANGKKLPFKAQWHRPGTRHHGKICIFTSIEPACSDRCNFIGREWGPKNLVANPPLGYGWIDPRIEDYKTQATEEIKSIKDLLENLIGDSVKEKERTSEKIR